MIVSLLLLASCVSPTNSDVQTESPTLPLIQIADYQFPDYAESGANQNGVELWLNGICAIDTHTVFLFGNLDIAETIDSHRSLLLRSSDGGRHWQEVQITPEYNESFYHVAFVNDGHGWALSAIDVEDFSAGTLYRSSDEGQTWSAPIPMGEWGFHPWGLKFTDVNNGQITFDKFTASPSDRFGIITTTDGGLTWTETFSVSLWAEKREGLDKVQTELDALKQEFAEPSGCDYGSHWVNVDEPQSSVNRAKGQDGSE